MEQAIAVAARHKTPVCPVCDKEMVRIDKGIWRCPDGHAETTIEEPAERRPPKQERPYNALAWVGLPDGGGGPGREPVSLSCVGSISGGGGNSNRGKSPSKLKQQAAIRRALAGANARKVRVYGD